MKRQIYTGLLQNLDEAYDAALEEMRGSFGTEDFGRRRALLGKTRGRVHWPVASPHKIRV